MPLKQAFAPRRFMYLVGLCFFYTVLAVPSLHAQQVRLDNLKEQFNNDNLLKINGGISASSIFYKGNNSTRDPFNWVLSGNVNFSFYNQFNMPFTFNINNLGGNYTYPTMPNRLSLHPSYKWITGHIGSVGMSFSPFTLNGHQFTGVGVDITPDIPFKFSVMYGRLLKTTEYNPSARLSTTAYKRMGYGAKARYEKEKISTGISYFAAYDDSRSLQFVPDSLQLYPKNNLALSWDVGIKLIKNVVLTAEYGVSFLTRDTRFKRGNAFFEKIFQQNQTTAAYHALRTNINYLLKKNAFGFGYERIDPNYQTLGAYYFMNDLENFTFNYARPLFNDKLNLALNLGVQHDNLGKDKQQQTNRFVGAININYAPNEKLNTAFSYSSFQTYTNIKSQFDFINEITNYDNLDTLNFTQLSQNANVMVNYNFGKSEAYKHSLNVNLNYQEAADKRGGIIRTGGLSRFYNIASGYGLLLVPQNIQLTGSLNFTYNSAANHNMLTYGPNIGITTKLFKKALTTGAGLGFNVTTNEGAWQGNIVNIRCNATYLFLKRHSLNCIVIHQSRNLKNKNVSNDFTTTFAYMYNF